MNHSESSVSDRTKDVVRTGGSRIRWWPLVFLLGAAIGGWLWIWFFSEISRQEKNIRTTCVGFGFVLLTLLWLLCFSRFRWGFRIAIFGSVIALISIMAALFKIRGVTGDLLPILEWRWQEARKPVPTLDPATKPMSAPPPSPHRDPPAVLAYPQFLGPSRNGTVEGPLLARNWKERPPKPLWRQAIGPAWSGFSILANRALTQEQWGAKEAVVCYDLFSGKVLWSHEDKARYHTTIAGEGPRATPTITGNRVYALGATGLLNCLDLETGRPVWSRDIIRDNQSRVNEWGMSCSPLLVDKLVVVSAGGRQGRSLVAYDKENGEFVWGGGNDGAGYSSACLFTLAGVRQILIFNSGGLASHEPTTGKTLWEYPWPKNHPHVAMPVVLPKDQVLISSGYGTGSELLQITRSAEDKLSAHRIWKSIRLKAKFTNVVFRRGFIYGLDDGTLVCLDGADGRVKWKEGRFGHGQVILSEDLLLVMAENGELVLLEAVPEEYRELSRFPALHGKTWNPPALAGEFLLVRNDREAACYQLPVTKP